jgi:hypothetical protein
MVNRETRFAPTENRTVVLIESNSRTAPSVGEAREELPYLGSIVHCTNVNLAAELRDKTSDDKTLRNGESHSYVSSKVHSMNPQMEMCSVKSWETQEGSAELANPCWGR